MDFDQQIPKMGDLIQEPYLQALICLANEGSNIIVLDADLAQMARTYKFAEIFPENHLQCGLAEQNMVGVAAGISACGYIPILNSFAVFATKRVADQLSISVAYPKLNVKVVGFEGGLISGRNGATHMAVEDLAIMRAMPNFIVIDPCDGYEIIEAVKAAIKYMGPVYIRMRRGAVPVIFDWTKEKFKIGKGIMLREGKDVSIFTSGVMTEILYKDLKRLIASGLDPEIIHFHTIKPIDSELVLDSIRKTKAVVTVENHSVIGGLGSAIAEIIGENYPVPLKRIGIKDCFGETGNFDYLLEKYGLTVENVISAAFEVIDKRGGCYIK